MHLKKGGRTMTHRQYIIRRKLNIVELGQVTLSWIIAPPEQIPSPEVLHNAELCFNVKRMLPVMGTAGLKSLYLAE